MNESVERCEQFLVASKLRYPLEPESPAVLMKLALEASDLNLRNLIKEVSSTKLPGIKWRICWRKQMLRHTSPSPAATPRPEKVMSECGSQGLGFDDGDYLELMFVMSEEQGAHR